MSHVNFVSGIPPIDGSPVSVKIRYKSPEVPAIFFQEQGGMHLRFNNPQRAVTPGQAAVLYDNDEVLGGGRISRLPQKLMVTGTQSIHA